MILRGSGRAALLALAIAVAAGPFAADDPGDEGGGHWPSFRGQRARGVAEGSATAVRWNAATGENILWKTAIPGLGHSSPVIWGDRLFLTTAIGGQADPELKVGLYGDIAPVEDDTVHRFRVYCLDKRTGKIRWERTAHEGKPAIRRHTKSTHANPTPATDGRRVVALFGSEGLYGYDLDGELKWKKDLGRLDVGFFRVPEAQWGFGSSPVIHDGRVIVQADVQGGGFLAAFDLGDGRELWRVAREDVPTWSTPTVYEDGGRTRIAVNGFREIAGYDLATGERLWRLRGGGDIPVPTPVVAHGLIFITNAHGGASPIWAVRVGARGELTPGAEGSTAGEHLAWSKDRSGAYMQTPLVWGDWLYVCRDNGALECLEARTGKVLYRQRLGSGSTGFTASAVAADGKLYYSSEVGEVHVVRAGPEFELLAENPMGEVLMASPAVSEGVLYFRTRGHVVAVGAKPATTAPPGPR